MNIQEFKKIIKKYGYDYVEEGEKIKVNGDLDISNTEIKELPET